LVAAEVDLDAFATVRFDADVVDEGVFFEFFFSDAFFDRAALLDAFATAFLVGEAAFAPDDFFGFDFFDAIVSSRMVWRMPANILAHVSLWSSAAKFADVVAIVLPARSAPWLILLEDSKHVGTYRFSACALPMKTKLEIARNWLPRYTGTAIDEFGDYILLTNFHDYIVRFAERFGCDIRGEGKPMQTATNSAGLTIINFGMGSANAATIMDLLVACAPRGVLFLGKCGGLKTSTEIGHFILPIAAIRGEGTSNDYLPPEVPALPSFKLHKFVSDKIIAHGHDYRTGVVYTTNRRVWEWDDAFRERLRKLSVIGIDMETATIFIVGHANEISRGALLLVSDIPLLPEGIKTADSDRKVTEQYADLHLQIGIEAMTEIGEKGEPIKHFRY